MKIEINGIEYALNKLIDQRAKSNNTTLTAAEFKIATNAHVTNKVDKPIIIKTEGHYEAIVIPVGFDINVGKDIPVHLFHRFALKTMKA